MKWIRPILEVLQKYCLPITANMLSDQMVLKAEV